jgi:hypothetical protein
LISKILRFFLKLVLGLFAAVFAVSLLVAALVVVLLSLLKSLVTGRKPAPAVVFGRFQRYSPQGMWPGGAGRDAANTPRANDVVDVEVREVREVRDK